MDVVLFTGSSKSLSRGQTVNFLNTYLKHLGDTSIAIIINRGDVRDLTDVTHSDIIMYFGKSVLLQLLLIAFGQIQIKSNGKKSS